MIIWQKRIEMITEIIMAMKEVTRENIKTMANKVVDFVDEDKAAAATKSETLTPRKWTTELVNYCKSSLQGNEFYNAEMWKPIEDALTWNNVPIEFPSRETFLARVDAIDDNTINMLNMFAKQLHFFDVQSQEDDLEDDLERENSQDCLLDKMFGKKSDILAVKSLEEMSKFADGVCRTLATDEKFLKSQIAKERRDTPQNYDDWNGTSFGNVAYLAVHALSPYRSHYVKTFQDYCLATNTPLSNYTLGGVSLADCKGEYMTVDPSDPSVTTYKFQKVSLSQDGTVLKFACLPDSMSSDEQGKFDLSKFCCHNNIEGTCKMYSVEVPDDGETYVGTNGLIPQDIEEIKTLTDNPQPSLFQRLCSFWESKTKTD